MGIPVFVNLLLLFVKYSLVNDPTMQSISIIIFAKGGN